MRLAHRQTRTDEQSVILKEMFFSYSPHPVLPLGMRATLKLRTDGMAAPMGERLRQKRMRGKTGPTQSRRSWVTKKVLAYFTLARNMYVSKQE